MHALFCHCMRCWHVSQHLCKQQRVSWQLMSARFSSLSFLLTCRLVTTCCMHQELRSKAALQKCCDHCIQQRAPSFHERGSFMNCK